MKSMVLAASAALMMSTPAFAADVASPAVKAVAVEQAPSWDVSFGVTGASDYIFRGMSQTNGNVAIQGFAELTMFDWLYAGAWASNVSFLDSGSAEVDVYAGVRHTWNKLTLDAGFVGYLYPGSSADTDLNFWEVYFKPSYQVTDWLNVAAHLYYTSDYIATKTDGTYLAGLATVTLPNFGTNEQFGWYLSGEFGRQWVDSGTWNDVFLNTITNTHQYVEVSSYNYWNVGVGFTYKVATLDLRYHGSDLDDNQCFLLSGSRTTCGDRFMGSLTLATAFSQLK